MTETSVEMVPYRSYAALQKDHGAHQKQQGKESTAVPQPVIEFVQQVIQAGVWLEDCDDRTAAQGIIDFWVSKSKSYRSADSEHTGSKTHRSADSASNESQPRPSTGNPLTDPDFDTLLADFDRATVQKSIGLTDTWANALPGEEKVLLRRMLSRLIRVRDDGSVVANSCTQESFSDLEPPGRVQEFLKRMQDDGIIRTASASSGLEIIQLRSRHFLQDWGQLAYVVDRRKQFRTQANQWKAQGRPGRSAGVWAVRRFVRRQLVSIGKRYDAVWSWVIRVWGRELVQADPFGTLPDVEFYRDRSPAEVDYVFEQRKLIKEQTEWLRVLKGLFLVFVAWLCFMGYAAYRFREHEKLLLAKDQETALGDQRTAAAETRGQEQKQEMTKRRARQRLKELMNLVRLLAQFHQYNSVKDYPRADAARWRMESGLLGMDHDDLELYGAELTQVGFDFDHKDGGICVECSGSPLEISRKLRDLIAERSATDSDTEKYRKNIKQLHYSTTINLIDKLIETLDGKGTAERPKTYLTVGSYLDEFWVLYHGEMAVVESQPVEVAMVVLGAVLRDLDRVYYSQIEKALLAIANIKPVATQDQNNMNAATKSYQLQSPDLVSQMQLDRRRTELLEQPIERWANSFNPSETAKLAAITAKLREQRQKLKDLLEKELKELSPLAVFNPETK